MDIPNFFIGLYLGFHQSIRRKAKGKTIDSVCLCSKWLSLGLQMVAHLLRREIAKDVFHADFELIDELLAVAETIAKVRSSE